MRDFVYYTPTKVYFGRGREQETGEIVRGCGCDRVLLVYGSESAKRSGAFGKVADSLRRAGVGFTELGGVAPNPVMGPVREGVRICLEEKIPMVLALGGGSVIDTAKLIAVGAHHPESDPWVFPAKEKVPEGALPVGVVLTLAASGSEMSASCVITREEGGLKRGYTSDFNRPRFAVMDPELTYSVPPYQTACGVVDILMHTIERYFMPEKEAELTHGIAEALMRAVIAAGAAAMEDPRDYDARATLMWAGSLSHNGLTGAGKREGLQLHQLGHEICGIYPHIAHAAALSALFPAWERFVMPFDPVKFARFAVNVWGCAARPEDPEALAAEGIARARDYFSAVLGAPVTLRELGISADRFGEMADKCTFFGRRTIPGIIDMGKQEILAVYRLSEPA